MCGSMKTVDFNRVPNDAFITLYILWCQHTLTGSWKVHGPFEDGSTNDVSLLMVSFHNASRMGLYLGIILTYGLDRVWPSPHKLCFITFLCLLYISMLVKLCKMYDLCSQSRWNYHFSEVENILNCGGSLHNNVYWVLCCMQVRNV